MFKARLTRYGGSSTSAYAVAQAFYSDGIPVRVCVSLREAPDAGAGRCGMEWLRETRVLTMDVYGTLLDGEGGLRGPLEGLLRGRTPGPEADVTTVLQEWTAALTRAFMEDALMGQERAPFRELVRRALLTVLRRHGTPASPEEAARLAARWDDLQPYLDAVPALHRLQGRYRLAVLSNGDPDMLQAAVMALGVGFDAVLSTAAAGSYKPRPRPTPWRRRRWA